MSEPIKKPNETNPESYSPKTPKLLNMMEEANASFEVKGHFPVVRTIEGIKDIETCEHTGFCRYVYRFGPLYRYLEKITGLDDRIFFPVTAMGFTTHWDTGFDEYNRGYRFTHGYIERSMRFAGYGYKIIEKENSDNNRVAIMAQIIESVNAGIPVLAYYNVTLADWLKEWQLIIGYDLEKDALEYKSDNEYNGDWYDALEYIVVITETGLEKSNIEEILAGIAESMEKTEFNGTPVGIGAYKACIDFLSDDAYFENLSTPEILRQNYRDVFVFGEGHAEQGGFNGEGVESLRSVYNDESLGELFHRLECNGYLHHQLSWCIVNLMDYYPERNPEPLKNKSVRTKIIYVLNQLIDNHAFMLDLIKNYLRIGTPNVYKLSRPDRKVLVQGATYATDIPFPCVHNPINNIEELNKRYSIRASFNIDLENGFETMDGEECALNNGELTMKSSHLGWRGNRIDDWGSLPTGQSFSTPLKIDVRAKSSGPVIRIYFNRGAIAVGKDYILVADPIIGYVVDYHPENCAPRAGEYMDISWILHNGFTAVVLNGEIVHYGENYPYMNLEAEQATVRIGTADGYDVTVKSLTVSELE